MRIKPVFQAYRRILAAAGLCIAISTLCTPPLASAQPSIKDHWHFFCTSKKVNKRVVAKAKMKVDQLVDLSLKTAIAQLDYACLLNIYEKQVYLDRLDKFYENGGKGKQPVLVNRGSNSRLKTATSSLRSAYRAKKSDPKAVYYYGYALSLAGNELAVNMFDTLMTRFKSSSWTQYAYLALGEYYFDRQEIDKAFREYKIAMKSKVPIVKNYTKYKLAWIDFIKAVRNKNSAGQKRAITAMTRIAKSSGRGKGKSRQLAKLIKANLIDILVELGDVKEAKRILRSVGATDVLADLLERMAYFKLNAGDAAGAYKLFGLAVKENPTGARSLVLSTNMVNLAGQLNNVPLVTANLKSMVANYVSRKGRWYRKQNKKNRKRAAREVETLLYDFSTSIDRIGRDQNNAQAQKSAFQLYSLFIKTFPKSKRSFELRYYRAQLIYTQGKFLEASKQLRELIKENPKSRTSAEAADIMITAAQEAIDKDKKVYKMPKPGQSLEILNIPPIQKNYAESLEAYLKIKPRDPNAPAMRYTAASVYYDWGHYDKAVKQYFAFIKRHPQDESAKAAAARIFIYYEYWKNKKGLKKAKKVIGAIPSLRNLPELAPFFEKRSRGKRSLKDKERDNLADGDAVTPNEAKTKKKKKSSSTTVSESDEENYDENYQEPDFD